MCRGGAVCKHRKCQPHWRVCKLTTERVLDRQQREVDGVRGERHECGLKRLERHRVDAREVTRLLLRRRATIALWRSDE